MACDSIGPQAILERDQEAIYLAMVLGRDVVKELSERSPPDLKTDILEVMEAMEYVIFLLERHVDPKRLAILGN